MLLAEWHQRGRIDLKTFWLRRARRLLPALYVLLVVTLAFAVVFLPVRCRTARRCTRRFRLRYQLVPDLRPGVLLRGRGRPSMLQHLWSLAVEEQFYLIWPPILALGLCIEATRLRQRRVLSVALLGAVASAVAMALLYAPGVDPSRIYYGTDTRATGLLCGAGARLLVVAEVRYRPSESHHPQARACRSGTSGAAGGGRPPPSRPPGFTALGGFSGSCTSVSSNPSSTGAGSRWSGCDDGDDHGRRPSVHAHR